MTAFFVSLVMEEKFILASASPRRRELLLKAGQSFKIKVADTNESFDENLSPEEVVKLLAYKKASKVYEIEKRPTLGADTVVVFNGKILGKPKDFRQAKEMLLSLSANVHEVITGVALITAKKTVMEYVKTSVKMNKLSDEFIESWINSGQAYDKAGAYAVQAGGFVSEYFGSYTNIVGLPMEKVEQLLKEFSLWQ